MHTMSYFNRKIFFYLPVCVVVAALSVWVGVRAANPTWKEYTLTSSAKSIHAPDSGRVHERTLVEAHRSDGARATVDEDSGIRDLVLPV